MSEQDDAWPEIGGGHDPWLWNTPEHGTGFISPGEDDDPSSVDLAGASGLAPGGVDGYADAFDGYGYADLDDAPGVDSSTTASQPDPAPVAQVAAAPAYGAAAEWSASDVNCYACAFGGVMGGWLVENGFLVQVDDKVQPTVRAGRFLAGAGLLVGLVAAFAWRD